MVGAPANPSRTNFVATQFISESQLWRLRLLGVQPLQLKEKVGKRYFGNGQVAITPTGVCLFSSLVKLPDMQLFLLVARGQCLREAVQTRWLRKLFIRRNCLGRVLRAQSCARGGHAEKVNSETAVAVSAVSGASYMNLE